MRKLAALLCSAALVMTLNIRAFTGATAIGTAVLFTLCALLIALASGAAYAGALSCTR